MVTFAAPAFDIPRELWLAHCLARRRLRSGLERVIQHVPEERLIASGEGTNDEVHRAELSVTSLTQRDLPARAVSAVICASNAPAAMFLTALISSPLRGGFSITRSMFSF